MERITFKTMQELDRSGERYCINFTQFLHVEANRLGAMIEQHPIRAIKVFEADIDEQSGLAAKFGVHYIPQAVVIQRGQVLVQHSRLCTEMTGHLAAS